MDSIPPDGIPPDSIPPDGKDWTWVLERACPQCGLDCRAVDPTEVAAMVRDNAARWVQLLAGHPQVATRPAPQVWSPLEYACHVRDVFVLYDQRLQLMLTEHDPLYANWDQDRTAVTERYGEQDPTTVAGELSAAAEAVAQRFAQVTAAQWERPGRRSDGARFTVASFARYFVHDPVHHLHDVAG